MVAGRGGFWLKIWRDFEKIIWQHWRLGRREDVVIQEEKGVGGDGGALDVRPGLGPRPRQLCTVGHV